MKDTTPCEVGVLPTDTLYGMVGDALDRCAVERIFDIKGRRPDKPVIVLVSDVGQLQTFGVEMNAHMLESLWSLWPGPVSTVLPVSDPDGRFDYVHRGTQSIAFRLPDVPADSLLMRILREKPLVAPSANPEGKPPAQTIEEARAYFGDTVDFYHDGGRCAGTPSALVRIREDGSVTVLRGTLPKRK